MNFKLILSLSIIGFSIESYGAEKCFSAKDLEYHEVYSATLAKELEDYFDHKTPAYHSLERQHALYLADTLTHYPLPHDDCLKELFFSRYRAAINSIGNTDVQTGAVIWNVYNMSYVVKTKKVTVAFDLTRLPPSLRRDPDDGRYEELAKEMVDLCDVLFISHIHGDHADEFVAGEFVRQNKPVIASPGIFKENNFYGKVLHLPADGAQRTLPVTSRNIELSLRIYPGHQQVSDTDAVDNNFTVVTLPNHVTVAHSGDQCWADDFEWIDTVHHDIKIDVLMVNTWTLSPDRLIDGLRPKITLPGHINEMNHDISGRIPFWKSYLFWENGKSEIIHLFWGEPYRYKTTPALLE